MFSQNKESINNWKWFFSLIEFNQTFQSFSCFLLSIILLIWWFDECSFFWCLDYISSLISLFMMRSMPHIFFSKIFSWFVRLLNSPPRFKSLLVLLFDAQFFGRCESFQGQTIWCCHSFYTSIWCFEKSDLCNTQQHEKNHLHDSKNMSYDGC